MDTYGGKKWVPKIFKIKSDNFFLKKCSIPLSTNVGIKNLIFLDKEIVLSEGK